MQEDVDLLRALRAGWWILPVVLAASVGGVSLFGQTGEEPPLYRSHVTLAAIPDSGVDNNNQRLRAVEILERRTMVSTLSRIPRAGPVRRGAAERMGTPLQDLAGYRVATRVLPNTHLVRVTVRGPDPEVAAAFANALAGAAEEIARGYYRLFALRLLDDAGVPGSPVGEQEKRSYAVAGVLGLFLGVGAAYGVGRLRLG